MINITKHDAYAAVAPSDFEAMLEPDRYVQRSAEFDRIISASQAHFWDPLDTRYVDYSVPFDLATVALMPEELQPVLGLPYVASVLTDPQDRVRFINEKQRWNFSNFLHGEQGALSLSASLCHVLKDLGAQEYAANQAREEARHVTAFSRYIQVRWGRPTPCGGALKTVLTEIVQAPEVFKKIVGMQLLVEGLAMGAFSHAYRHNRDPLARRVLQLVMTDEAFHHKFGKAWAARTVPDLTEAEHGIMEDWATHCAQLLLLNQASPEQQQALYAEFGLDPDRVLAEIRVARESPEFRKSMQSETHVFRVLVRTLLNAGIITSRTKSFYGAFFDLDALAAEGDAMPGDDIAQAGMGFLSSVRDAVA